ncbi:MAG: biotin--[acetyl-CoA-carboxylase] ligase [Pseudomonadota bacterium]
MIRTVEETGSTNADLVAALRAGETVHEGDWLIAKRQHAGRGRQGRKWEDGADRITDQSSGNFMGSTVVHLDQLANQGPLLNLAVSIALHDAVSDFLTQREDLLLKWPNDLLLRGAKMSGVLLERVEQSIVVGVGVNLAYSPDLPDRKTISLADIGPVPARQAFAERVAMRFSTELGRWREFGEEPLRRRWLELGHPIGTLLSVHDVDGTRVSGHFEGLASGGAMLLRLADGESRAIHVGDVSID